MVKRFYISEEQIEQLNNEVQGFAEESKVQFEEGQNDLASGLNESAANIQHILHQILKCPEERGERTLDEIVKIVAMLNVDETERWEEFGRPQNDGYINGSHSGYGHALRDVHQWVNRIKQADSVKVPR